MYFLTKRCSALAAMAPYYDLLTPEERARNKHGPMRLYSYTEESLGTYKAPEYFRDVVSHANVRLINRDEIIVPPEKLVRGLCPNVQLDVYHPGFPTLQYIKHTAALKKAEVGLPFFRSLGRSRINDLARRAGQSISETHEKGEHDFARNAAARAETTGHSGRAVGQNSVC